MWLPITFMGSAMGNAASVVQEYERQFSNWQTSDWQVISDMQRNLQQTRWICKGNSQASITANSSQGTSHTHGGQQSNYQVCTISQRAHMP
jgi:hypothetical protein